MVPVPSRPVSAAAPVKEMTRGDAEAGGIGERLDRLEELLRLVLARLEALEELLGGLEEAAARAVRISLLSGAPVAEAVEQALRVLEAARLLGRVDPITEALLEALSGCEWLSVSEAARRVRRLRGTASREAVRKRLRMLVERGVVERLGEGTAARYRLALCG